MAVMTAAQTAAELQRKKNLGINPTNSANQAQYDKLTAVPKETNNGLLLNVNKPRMEPGVTVPGGSSDLSMGKVATAPPATPPAAQGGFTYGTDPAKSNALVQNVNTWNNDAAAKNAEIQRALAVRDDLKSKGLDYSAQDKHLTQTLNYKAPVDATLAEEPVTPEPTDYSWITEMVNNELANQKTTIEQELARLTQANDLAVTQNNTFLTDSIKKLEENRIKAGEQILSYQNRRGGFYSGGVDYQTAQNNDAFATQEGSVTKDIGARNADIWSRNRLLAEQAATNLAALQNQAPARIQQLIAEQMEKDRQAAIQEAGITGMYKGAPTMDMNKLTFDQGLATNKLNLDTRTQDMNEVELMAKLTGYLPDGRPTSEYQQTILKNAWDVIGQIGYVPNELAGVVGVPAGTKTLDAKQVAIQQQNANTSSSNADLSRTKFNQDNDANGLQAQIMDGIAQFDNAAEASAWLNANASSITASLGADTFAEMKKMLPLFFGEDTSATDAKTKAEAAKKLRSEAVDMAAKDYRWKVQSQDKEALIQEYMQILAGNQGYSGVTR
jgi:hypothetical protein